MPLAPPSSVWERGEGGGWRKTVVDALTVLIDLTCLRRAGFQTGDGQCVCVRNASRHGGGCRARGRGTRAQGPPGPPLVPRGPPAGGCFAGSPTRSPWSPMVHHLVVPRPPSNKTMPPAPQRASGPPLGSADIAEPNRTLPSPSKGRAGHGWAGPRARPNLAEPVKGHGRAWLGWSESPSEPCRAHQRAWQGLGWAGGPSEPCRAPQGARQGMAGLGQEPSLILVYCWATGLAPSTIIKHIFGQK